MSDEHEAETPSAIVAAVAQHKLTDLSLRGDVLEDAQDAAASSEGSDYTAAAAPPFSLVDAPADETLCRAEMLAAQGRISEALKMLEPELSRRPGNADMLCLQGRCLASLGHAAHALACFAGALAVDPGNVAALLGCAALHKESGQLEQALTVLENAYDSLQSTGTSPTSPHDAGTAATTDKANDEAKNQSQLKQQVVLALATVLTDLGTQTKLTGGQGWRAWYERAAAVCPRYAPAHYNLAVAASEAGKAEEAEKRYIDAVDLDPRYAEAWCNLGVLYRGRGKLKEAVEALERAHAAAPSLDVISINLAAALTEQGAKLKSDGAAAAAVRAYERALAVRPGHAEALYNLGVACVEAGELDRAAFMYQLTISAAPNCAEAHNNLGVLHRERGDYEVALRCYEAALAIRPSFPQALNNLAVMYTQQGRALEALNMLRAALMANANYAEAHNNLGGLQRDFGDVPAAVASYERCCDLDPDNRNGGQNRLLALNYVHHGDSEFVCAAHAAWGRRFQELHPPLPQLTLADVDTTPDRPLVVGYVSPDLFTHSVSYFAEAPISLHDPSRVRHVVYNVCPCPDAKTQRLRQLVETAGGTWKESARMSEAELAQRIRADKIDILVELTGHTAHNRLGVVARRPAPLQVTWIGYPNSTGLPSVQYRITDAVCDPLDTRQTFTEQLVRLPGCFLCYTPSPEAPPVAPLPALRNGFVTFGSFNALAKQTPDVLRVWARLLRSIPGSRLVLKNKPFACDATRERFWTFFEEQGVARHRVDLLPLAPATRDHLEQYALVDIALDPWPYAGTTTTAEALYMGVPCLTMVGRCHAHNVGRSLLTAVGLGDEWIVENEDQYVTRGVELVADIASLAELRAGLREQMLGSRLCDGPGFVRNLEDTYRLLWKRWVQAQHQADS